MSWRAIIIGLVLVVMISMMTYFNDVVIKQNMLIGNTLPLAVFGPLMVLLLACNPLLGKFSSKAPLRPGEIALIAAMGMACCGWPGSNFFRGFIGITALPNQLYKIQTAWQTVGVQSYLPGGSPLLAEGHLRDITGLAKNLAVAASQPADTVAGKIWSNLKPAARKVVCETTENGRVPENDQGHLLDGLNAIITQHEILPEGSQKGQPAFYQTLDPGQQPAGTADKLQERNGFAERIITLQDELAELNKLRATRRQEHEAERQQLLKGRTLTASRLAKLRDQQDSGSRNAESQPAGAALSQEIATLQGQLGNVSKRLRTLDWQIEQNDNRLLILRGVINYWGRQVQRCDEQINRRVLEATWPGMLTPAPEGKNLLLANGEADALAVDTLVKGWDGRWFLRPDQLPWEIWWPTLRLWGGVALLMATALLAMMLIVHPQWSQRELLPYPIAQFVQELTQPSDKGGWPKIASNNVFWIGFLIVLSIHLINGLQVSFVPESISIPLRYNLWPLAKLFPNASKGWGSWGVFGPSIYPSFIAFAFFLNASVAFSIGINEILWLTLSALLISNGIPMSGSGIDLNSMIRCGAYLGGALMVLYVGRRYYANVLTSALGFARHKETPAYAPWAARVMILCLTGTIILLSVYGGLYWPLSIMACLLVLVMMLMLARISAETGCVFIQPGWAPISFIVAIMGIQGVGPSAYLGLIMFGLVVAGDPREAFTPFFTNALQMTSTVGKERPTRVAPILLMVMVAGFFIALVTTFTVQYNLGKGEDTWTTESQPKAVYESLSLHLSELGARGELAQATAVKGLEHFTHLKPNGPNLLWLSLGLGLVLVCALARLRLPWWPLHPVVFMLWGTWAGLVVSTSFLLGSLVKAAVVRLAGAKGYQAVKPFMVGLIAGELTAAMFWMIVGLIYYGMEGKGMQPYSIFSG